MEYRILCESDRKFMTVVWENEPVSSNRLVSLCLEKLGWKKSTTYTMLRKLCEKGLVRNENSTVTSLVPREKVMEHESAAFVEQSFGGSLPSFLVSFFGGRKLNEAEAEELKKLIDSCKED